MREKRALITGIGGQDGAYLAGLLLEKGYEVHGTSRDSAHSTFPGLRALGLRGRVRLHSMALRDLGSVLSVLTAVAPDEVYHLAAPSAVALSFEQPLETFESIAAGTLNVLEAVRLLKRPIRLYHAGSSEAFGDTGEEAADVARPFRPRSPYGVAKAAACFHVANYREAYGLFACSGLLFNHESPLRPERYVTQKIVRAARRIAGGEGGKLTLGNIAVKRDWGWAPEYVEAMWLMLQRPDPGDFVVATGRQHSLEDFVAAAFSCFSLDWREHVELDPALARPCEIDANVGNPQAAAEVLGWRARSFLPDVVRRMVEAPPSGER